MASSSTSNNSTFVKITNEDIYQKLCSLERNMGEFSRKMSVTRWIATTALTLSIAAVSAMMAFNLG